MIFRSFQSAVFKNINERNAQLQKQLDNVIREGCYFGFVCKVITNLPLSANGEISLLNNKVAGRDFYPRFCSFVIIRPGGLDKDLELERRKVRELQESSRERDKEYQKLKVFHNIRSFLLSTLMAIMNLQRINMTR